MRILTAMVTAFDERRLPHTNIYREMPLPLTYAIMSDMSAKTPSPLLDRLVGPLGQCLTPESAKRIVELQADPQTQALIDELSEKCNEGTLTPEERGDYASYVSFGTFVALLKSKARQLLANSSGK